MRHRVVAPFDLVAQRQQHVARLEVGVEARLAENQVCRPIVFRVPVPVVAHELADPEKGSGIAMICTFGDTTDVTWWRELQLDTRPIIGWDGRILPDTAIVEAALAETQLATPYDGRDINLAMIYHALGRKSASDAALARLTRDYGGLWPQNIAQVYAYRGEADQAFEWFEKAYAARKFGLLPLLRDDPTVARLRTDPRRSPPALCGA